MQWFWMNIPLAAMFFAIWTGVPVWLVLKHPDAPHQAQVAESAEPRAVDGYRPRHARGSRVLQGARR